MKISSLNLLFCSQYFFIEQKKNILKKICNEKNYQLIFTKIENDNYKEAIQKNKQELHTSSFFYDKKILLIENISFLFAQKKIDLSFLLNYFEKPRDNIIIYLIETKNNFTPEIQKKIFKYFNIEKIPNINQKNLFFYIQNLFKKENFIIDDNIVQLLTEEKFENLFLLNQTIEKIKLYFLSNKNINDIEIIKKIIYNEEKNIFLLIETILKNEKKSNNLELFEYLNTQKKNSSFVIIQQILKKLQEIILIQNFKKEKKYFYIKELKKEINNEEINNLFLFFFDLYYQVKKGTIDPYFALKNFLIKKNIQ